MPPKIWTRGLLNPPPESAIDVSHADTHGRMSRYVGLQHPWESENEELNSDHEITPQSDHEITPDAREEMDPLPEARDAAAPRRPLAWSQPVSAARAPAGARAPMWIPAMEPLAAEGEADEDDERPGEAAGASGGERSPTEAPRGSGR